MVLTSANYKLYGEALQAVSLVRPVAQERLGPRKISLHRQSAQGDAELFSEAVSRMSEKCPREAPIDA